MKTYESDSDKKILCWSNNPDKDTIEQAQNMAKLPFVHDRIILAADCHKGYGCPIGSIMATTDCIATFCVGSDIGCGLAVCKTAYKAKDVSRKQIKLMCDIIDGFVPTGRGNVHSDAQGWDDFKYLDEQPHISAWLSEKKRQWVERSLGTLGAGNHMIEIDKGADGNIYLMVHSGSRNLGYLICSYYHAEALKMNTKWHSILPDRSLAYLPIDSILGHNYIKDMGFALKYAKENRRRMMEMMQHAVIRVLSSPNYTSGDEESMIMGPFHKPIDVHHNYVAQENHDGKNLWVHRKGAIRAYDGELGVVPGSQGTSSYIVRGLGNPSSFQSCSHGAGRKLGRIEACKKLNLAEEEAKMAGIVFKDWATKNIQVDGVKKPLPNLEEAPGAYKDIEEVMEQQKDLIEKVMKLTPLGVIKG